MSFTRYISLVACMGLSFGYVRPAEGADGQKEAANVNAGTGAYRLLGILDPERDQMVAFALKVPRDWRAEQSFKRQWEGALPQNKVYISLRSPDGASQIEYLPSAQYVYSEGPLTENLRRQRRQFGLPPQASENEMPPMQPVDYVKKMMLPYLARNGATLSDIGNEQTAREERSENGQITRRGSVDGTLSNGHKARVECRIGINSQRINGETYYSWSVVPSITQTTGDLEAAHAHTRVAQDSIVVNPAWQELEQAAQNRGAQVNSEASRRQHEATMNQIHSNTAAMTRAHEQRMGDIRRFGEANTARFNQRMQQMDENKAAFDRRMGDMDRQQELRVDTIRGVSKFSDPSTGERVKVEDGYNHTYRSRHDPNVYYQANTPIDSGEVDWRELQKVDAQDY